MIPSVYTDMHFVSIDDDDDDDGNNNDIVNLTVVGGMVLETPCGGIMTCNANAKKEGE